MGNRDRTVAGEKLNAEVDVDDVSGRLAAGLETCRAVIANYQSLLSERDGEAMRGDRERGAQTSFRPSPLRD
jgi:hypothetical protein